MRITYIAHSGFLVEINGIYFLFDYYRGEIPRMPDNSRLFVFSSHRHEDHFNPEIMKLREKYHVTYILSYDIRLNAYGMRKYGISEEMKKDIISIGYDQKQVVDGVQIRTYKSSDAGVSFLVQAAGRVLYHAGDHNWWHWMGETKQYNHNMEAIYKRGIAALKKTLDEEKLNLDVAFVPLDPRLEESYDYGMKYFLENIECDNIFPMHFSTDPSCIEHFLKEFGCQNRVHNLSREGMQMQV